ncbi:hypothetical protein ACS127_16300 [Amphibacillus sp. Q70]|uniref:hypothetical protein n=1 Tax=Amphibacillus sp. Q70 TaxID=3453416 RepID=UPI003F85D5E0
MNRTRVICEKCNGPIESSGDLVTDVVVLSVVAYHEDCYANELKRGSGFFLSGRPLNSWSANLVFLLAVIAALSTLFFFKDWYFLFLACLIPIGYRLYSFFVYEWPLKKS